MSHDNIEVKQKGNKEFIASYITILYTDRRVMHTILLTFCAMLLFGDFLTTTVALSLVKENDDNQGVTVSEGNPFMATIVHTPVLFLFVKILILLTVVASSYLLRKEGAVAYLPCILVCLFYIGVNLNNINVLVNQLAYV